MTDEYRNLILQMAERYPVQFVVPVVPEHIWQDTTVIVYLAGKEGEALR